MNIRRSIAALQLPASIVIGLLAVSSAMGQSGTPATPIALKLTASENAMTVSTTNSTTWDSLIVSHRAVSPLVEVHLAALAADKGQMDVLKAIGARLWTDQTTFITLPEGGIYWAFAHNEAGWASARIELPLPEGRLAVWRDAATNHLLVRISVPSQVAASTKLALLLDNVQISEQAISGYAMPGTGYDASNLSSDSKTLWLSIPVTPEAKGTLKAIFELTPKPIELEVLRPTTSAVLAGASHLLERLTKEKGNPLLNVSTTGTPITYAPATQLGYWKSLVETIPTWQGYGELFEKLLTKKKGTHTTWDGTEAELNASDLSSAMSAVAASALTPRQSQQNLTGPVYYGAYTRAMLDNDLHFPLKEGEVLQVLWQGSVDLYYYEPNPTDPNSHDSVLTKLSLPNNPDGTAPKDPYGTVKQLLLTKGASSDLYAKIANNGLWVKGVRNVNSNEPDHFSFTLERSSSSLFPQEKYGNVDHVTNQQEIYGLSNKVLKYEKIIATSRLNQAFSDTVALIGCAEQEIKLTFPKVGGSETWNTGLVKGSGILNTTILDDFESDHAFTKKISFFDGCSFDETKSPLDYHVSIRIDGNSLGEKLFLYTLFVPIINATNEKNCDILGWSLFAESCRDINDDQASLSEIPLFEFPYDSISGVEMLQSAGASGTAGSRSFPPITLPETEFKRIPSILSLTAKQGFFEEKEKWVVSGESNWLSASQLIYTPGSSSFSVSAKPLSPKRNAGTFAYLIPGESDILFHTVLIGPGVRLVLENLDQNGVVWLRSQKLEKVTPVTTPPTYTIVGDTIGVSANSQNEIQFVSGVSIINFLCLNLSGECNLKIGVRENSRSNGSPIYLKIRNRLDDPDLPELYAQYNKPASTVGKNRILNYLNIWDKLAPSATSDNAGANGSINALSRTITAAKNNGSDVESKENGGWVIKFGSGFYPVFSPLNEQRAVKMPARPFGPMFGEVTAYYHSHPIGAESPVLGHSISGAWVFSSSMEKFILAVALSNYFDLSIECGNKQKELPNAQYGDLLLANTSRQRVFLGSGVCTSSPCDFTNGLLKEIASYDPNGISPRIDLSGGSANFLADLKLAGINTWGKNALVDASPSFWGKFDRFVGVNQVPGTMHDIYYRTLLKEEVKKAYDALAFCLNNDATCPLKDLYLKKPEKSPIKDLPFVCWATP